MATSPTTFFYFTKDTEKAIVRYNNEPNSEIRSDIYRDEIHYPFFKLTENIIHTFKFYYTEVDNIEHLQHYYETFLDDGKCRAVKSRKLLEESRELIFEIEEDVWERLLELGYHKEASELRPDRNFAV